MVYEQLKKYFSRLVEENSLGDEKITIEARPLSPDEAIGTPRHGDYPLLKGRERLMEAVFRGSCGQAYTDLFGNYLGSLGEVGELDLDDNFTRAVFISSLNAVMRSLKLVGGTVHCRDEEPILCARELPGYLNQFGEPEKIALVGLQPRLLDVLSGHFQVRVTDRDDENIGTRKKDILIESPDKAEEHIRWCDLALITGTTVVNGTIEKFIGIDKPAVFYGVTIAGPAEILGLNRFCALGH
jgi:hypothetical protein